MNVQTYNRFRLRSVMQADYNEKRAKVPAQKRERWSREQAFIRAKISQTDDFAWKPEELQLVAGVDVSFSSKFPNGACVGLVIYSVKARKIIYEDFMYVLLKQEYIPGYLAFRELPPTLHLFRTLKKNKPNLWPQLVLVDGNGILHKYQCGYASHLGVLLDIPTIGCAKTFFDIDGLHQSQVEAWLKDQLRVEGESITIKGKSGKEWCKAILTNQNEEKHLFISIGHRISLSTACQAVLKLTWRDCPEPIRLTDLISRKMIRKMQEEDYKSAPSFDMIYLSK